MLLAETFNNQSLNTAERCATFVSLKEIQVNENFDSTQFWGKINGIERDYIIVRATTTKYTVTHKYFYSCDAGLTFAQLPLVEPWMEEKCMQIAEAFTGTTSHIYDPKKPPKDEEENEEKEEEEEETTEEDENGEDKENKEIDPNFGDSPPEIEHELTELDRLAWTIYKIDFECLLTPKDYLRLNVNKIMIKNVRFNGLTVNEANKLESFYHFRSPISKNALNIYKKATVCNNDSMFLDSLSNDLPNGCWRIKSINCGLNVTIKNLLWPGFEFKYSVVDKSFKQCYYGNGIRQNDLLFLI